MTVKVYGSGGALIPSTSMSFTPLAAFSAGASFSFPAGFTMASGSAFLPCQSVFAGAQTVTIPTAIGSNNVLWIMDTGLTAQTFAVTIVVGAGSIIGPFILNSKGQSLWLLDANGIGWVSR